MNTPSHDGESIDPFFEVIHDAEWNACISDQGDELNYVDGYLEATLELVAAVIDKKMMASRDTLAMPILYNGRHALEIALKFAVNRLHQMGVLSSRHEANHDILSHWKLLNDENIGDATIRELIRELETFVVSLSKIDDDGQELRYAENRDGEKSLSDHVLVNLQHIRSSLEKMVEILTRLKYRVLELGDERPTGSHTRNCSRSDLKEMAVILGNQETWKNDSFFKKKAMARARFDLSSGKFSDAIDTIRQSRELAALVGIETPLAYISDEKALFAMEQWIKHQPEPEAASGPIVTSFSNLDWETMRESAELSRKLDKVIENNLSNEEFSDIEVLFYVGRDNEFGEYYKEMLERTVKEHQLAESRWKGIHHIMSKMNLFEDLVRGCEIVGRPSLAEKLRALKRE